MSVWGYERGRQTYEEAPYAHTRRKGHISSLRKKFADLFVKEYV